jgi:hypothetical protein
MQPMALHDLDRSLFASPVSPPFRKAIVARKDRHEVALPQDVSGGVSRRLA